MEHGILSRYKNKPNNFQGPLQYGVKLIAEGGRGGRVVNVSSIAGITGISAKGGSSPYGVSKFGLCGLTKIMALEYAPEKIRINAIAPAAIETDLIKQYIEMAADKVSLAFSKLNRTKIRKVIIVLGKGKSNDCGIKSTCWAW